MKYYVKYKISENIAETPEGYLICIGVPIARTGEMIYGDGETPIEADSKGIVKITRDESEVFKAETIASFEGKAITIKHPEQFVGPDNWSELAKGVMQNVRRGEGDQKDDLIADLLITDKMAIGLVKNGLREVSCGYEADYVQTDEGKGKQKNIIGNHLALVNQGRAGSGYAINDHKGDIKMNFKDRVKAIFAKAQDEAMKMAEDAEKEEGKAKDEDKEDDKKSKDAGAYDELVKMVKDLGEKISAMGPKSKDEDKEEKKDDAKDDDKEEKKDDKAKDDESSGMEDRLKACEAAIEKLLEKAGDEDMEESEDEDEEESEDDDFENSSMVGDSTEILSRAEILAPGLKKSKDLIVKALKTSYGTKEGKKVIDSLTGGKAPAFDSAEKVATLFIAASEVLKASRTTEFSKTKQTKDYQSSLENDGPMTAEKMNEVNEKFYKKA